MTITIDGVNYEVLGVCCSDGIDPAERDTLIAKTGVVEGSEYLYCLFMQRDDETGDPMDLLIISTRSPREIASTTGTEAGYPFEQGDRVYAYIGTAVSRLNIDSIGAENIWLES